jgi:hypothetical protein
MAVALGVSADLLLFAKDERGPDDDSKPSPGSIRKRKRSSAHCSIA